MSEYDINKLPRRPWAHPFDHSQPGQTEPRGHDASSEAIGGYFGISWLQAFRDHETGEVYAVTCFDGTNRSKGMYTDEDEEWMQRAQERIIRRTKDEVEYDAELIKLSSEEWALMSNRVFYDWFDLLPGERYKTVADEHRYQRQGHVGTINGVSVVVDPTLPNPLGNPPSDQRIELQQELDRIDHDEDLAESFGY